MHHCVHAGRKRKKRALLREIDAQLAWERRSSVHQGRDFVPRFPQSPDEVRPDKAIRSAYQDMHGRQVSAITESSHGLKTVYTPSGHAQLQR